MIKPRLRSVQLDLEGITKGSVVEERDFMFEVDREKAFKKLASKQFKDPTLALREIVSNALDSYAGTDSTQTVDIVLDGYHFEVMDYGEGFTEDKIDCLRTLGQSDKRGEEGFIGRFGIGFASLFHPDLSVQRVLIDTKVNGGYERLEFSVEDIGVTLKRYDLEGVPPFSTRVRAEFGDLSMKRLGEMRETLENEAKYMNADIVLNGKDISGKELFNQTRRYMLDLEGRVTGRICFFDGEDEREKNTKPKVALLSHNVYVEHGYSDIFVRRNERDFALPPFFGFVNCDDLNVITSRNDFKKDERYKAFTGEVRREVRKKFRELCGEVGETRDSELRKILMKSFIYNQNFYFGQYHPDKIQDACAKALEDAPIFTAWNHRGVFSLRQLHSIGRRQGHLLFARNGDTTELLDLQGYEAPIVRMEDHCYPTFKGIETFALDALHTWKGQTNEEFYEKLVQKGVIDPEKLKTRVDVVEEDSLSNNERNFLTGLRGILQSSMVKETLAKLGLDTDYSIHIADITPTGVAACYSDLGNHICINRANSISAQYMMEQEGNTALFYIPILAHELSHNIAGRHDNPFYNLSDELSSKLTLAIAEEMVT
ncbi:hypothetical protein CMI42_02330 [Candidatus Pacearchaeota archaeon]|nr:hypothetical protein [Candidatus Pacearchaeota archaeon]